MPTFEPPVAYDLPRVLPGSRGPGYWLFRHFSPLPRGRTVLKSADGTYRTVDNPTQLEVLEAAVAYLGGHVYDVDAAEAAALTAAGYTVT